MLSKVCSLCLTKLPHEIAILAMSLDSESRLEVLKGAEAKCPICKARVSIFRDVDYRVEFSFTQGKLEIIQGGGNVVGNK